MNKSHSLARLLGIVSLSLPAFLATEVSLAQSAWQGPLDGLWNDETNWTAGVPNAQDGQAQFTNSATVNLDGITASVATLGADGTATNTVVISNGTINLDSSGGSWGLSVAPAGSLRLLGGLSGLTNESVPGLAKNGAGTLSFFGNTNDLTFEGLISLNEGKILINQDGSMGQSGNDLAMAAGTVLIYGTTNATGSTTLNAGRSITLPAGGQGGFEALPGHILTIAGEITNSGTAADLRKYGTGTLILSGAANYGGQTIVSGGKLQLGTNTVLATNANIQFSDSGTLDLAGLVANVPAVTMTTDTNIARTFTMTNGAVSVTPTGNFAFNGAQGTTANFAGLTSFVFNGPTRTFFVQPSANNASNNTNFFFLAATEQGSNSITASTITVGGAASSAGTNNASQLFLGKINTFYATNLTIGGFNAAGLIEASVGLTNTSLTIRSSDGVGAANTIKIGETSSGTRNGSGALSVGSGSLNIAATNIQIGRHVSGSANAETSSMTFGGGSIVATNLTLSEKTGTGAPTITSTINQAGGLVSVTTLTMGVGTTSNALPVLRPTYNLNGGTLQAASIVTGFGGSGTNFATSTQRRINWGGGTIRPLSAATNLTVTGTTGTGGSIDILGFGPATKTLTTDGSNSITLAATTWLNANGGDIRIDPGTGGTFSTTGSFTVGSGQFPNTNSFFTNVINASITVASGTANLTTASRIFGIGDRTNASVTNSFNVVGGVVNLGLTSNRMLVGNKSAGEVNVSGGVLNITGNQPIYVGGDLSFGANNAQGTWTVSGGSVNLGGSAVFVLGQNSYTATNNITSNSVGVLNLNGGTLTTARAITTGVNTNGTTSTGTVNFNGGTLAAGTNVANLIAVTTATVASNTTIDTGTFDSGIGQNLLGSGILTVSGTGTLRLNGSNSTPVVVNSGATLGGTGTAGSMVVNGTVAPGLAATNGTLTSTASVTVPGAARFRLFANGSSDRLVSSGTVDLSGGSVTVTNNYPPANGDTYDLIDGAISGSPTLNLPTLDGGLVWVTNDFASSGVLSVTNGSTPTNNYDSWVAFWQTNSGGTFTNTGGTSDPDGDGFVNNLEFAFDGNPTVGTPALMTVTPAGTNAVFNWVQRLTGASYEVQKNTTLTNAWGSAVVTISNSANTNGILIPADYLRKEFVVPASGKDFYRVQATITNN